MTAHDKIIRSITHAGIKAGENHPKAKLWAEVNHEDNFCLAISSTIYDAMLEQIAKHLDAHDRVWRDWFNEHSKELNGLALTTGRAVYRIFT